MSAARPPAERAGTLVVRGRAIVWASEGAAALAGRAVADVLGRPFEEFVAPDERTALLDRYARRLRGEEAPAAYEVGLVLPGGARRTVEVHVERDGADAVVHLRGLELRDARRLRLEAVATLGAALQRELAEAAIHARVRGGLAELGLASALLRREGERVRWVWAAVDRALAAAFHRLAGEPLDGYLGQASAFTRRVAAEGYAFTEDWSLEASHLVAGPLAAGTRAAVAAAGIGRAIVVRLDRREGDDLALVVAGDWLEPEDGPAVRLFAAQLAAALDAARAVEALSLVNIENARLYDEARGRLEELATVIEVARVVSSSLDLEEVLGAGAEHLARTLDADACTVLLEDVRSGELRRAAARGAAVGPQRVPREARSLARAALDARAPLVGRAPGARGENAAVLAVPLHVRGHPVGVALVAAGLERAFTPGELARAGAIASQLAVAVENARLYSETRRRAEELGLLHEVGRSLVATLDIERLLEAGVRNLARIVDAPAAFLALAAAADGALEICAVSGPHREFLGRRLPTTPSDGNLLSRVFHTREPVVIEDALEDARVNQAIRALTGGRGYLGLPLAVRDRTIGSVLIVDTRAPRRFTPAEVERAAAIANQLAVAVENARLYEDLRRSYGELERAQRQLVERERLAALGELSAVVAHEVRNPLGVIFNSLGSLRRLLRPSGDAKLLLDIVGEEADRLNRIVGDLLDFARPSTPQLETERLERVVEDALAAALAQQPSGLEVARELDPSLPPVPMDARLVRQAVLNVAVNAVQAMPRGGRMTVRTRREDGAAVLEVEDTGPGISEEVRGRIFEPFFTTKASGTGLGLAVVRRIVEGHGGAVTVTSRPGAGTVFALRFPLAAAGG